MDKERYQELTTSEEASLTIEEVEEGWQFCEDWDFMLIHKDQPEFESCTCEWDHKGKTVTAKEYYKIIEEKKKNGNQV